MKILMTGATGTIGNALGRMLVDQGHSCVVVTRSKTKAHTYLEFPAEIIEHDLVSEALNAEQFQDVDAVVHLMGETIDGRWSEEKKKAILDSRRLSSEHLLKNLPPSIQVVVSASAQGIYGSRGDDILTEDSSPGQGFLAEVCEQWEKPFRQIKQRSVQLRIGLVLDSQSGFLKKMIPLFQKGLGGVLSNGNQWMSWIALEDLVQVIYLALQQNQISGPVNAVSPEPLQNKVWTEKLCQSLGVFQSLPVPGFALKLVLGEMSELALTSARLEPKILNQFKFSFKYKHIDDFLQSEVADYKNSKGVFQAYQYLDAPLDEVFKFFAEAKNLERITPPLLNFKIAKMSTETIQKNTIIDYALKVHGFPMKWKTLIKEWNPPYEFVDNQESGPYVLWHHRHSFRPMGAGVLMSDRVNYKLPFGFLGHAVAGDFVRSDVQKIFTYRREIMSQIDLKGRV